ncbi:MAG: GTPase [Candidatus Carsonella ruddii]
MKIIFAKVNSDKFSTINIIRISGKNVLYFIKKLIKKKSLIIQKLTYIKLYDLNNIFIENVLISYFKSPNSFTGDDVVEIHYHSNKKLSKIIIKNIIKLGAEYALPGEFLEKRYLNGKINLMECEMVNNFISYNKEKIFKIKNINEKNIFLCSIKNLKFKINIFIICLEISFNEKKLSIIKDFIFIKFFLKKIFKLINLLIIKFEKINYFKNIKTILIIGKRNVGKSSFYNKICNKYNSIISNKAGTTRNTIINKISIFKKKIKIIDTAGLKIKTKSLIEKIGILKNINNINYKNLILYVLDKYNIKNIFFNMPIKFLKNIKKNKIVILINKCDLLKIKEGIYKIKNFLILFLSVKNGKMIKKIKCFIYKKIKNKNFFLNKYIYKIKKKCYILKKNFFCSYDIIMEKIINFQKEIFKISGNYTNKNIINSIFRNFCLGK